MSRPTWIDSHVGVGNADERLAASKDLLEQWEREVLVPFVNEDQLKHLRRAMG